MEDAKCAVRFMRSDAVRLGIDASRIGTWGSSAGGQLVALLARPAPMLGRLQHVRQDCGYRTGQSLLCQPATPRPSRTAAQEAARWRWTRLQ
ncbi:MAG TPA: hypothetical protein VIN12_02275 [Candidatus Dormibacteraeota bacterium]